MAKQNFVGLVVSQGKMNKTVKVRVQTKAYDKVVHKEVLKRKDYLVHDEGNICKEGDVVRIESIPKISARKYFAVAEMKVNKGQKFALYQSLAKEKVAAENEAKLQALMTRRHEYAHVIKKVEDLKALDRLTMAFHSNRDADKEAILRQVDEIKLRYNIEVWPTTEPVVTADIVESDRDLAVLENRVLHIKAILDKLMSPEYATQRQQMLEHTTKGKYGDVNALERAIQKNLLRKYVLDARNLLPVSL